MKARLEWPGGFSRVVDIPDGEPQPTVSISTGNKVGPVNEFKFLRMENRDTAIYVLKDGKP